MAVYDITTTVINPKSLRRGDIINCPYSGSVKSITLPVGTYQLEVWGAMGGYRSNILYAGKGGYAKGTLNLTAKQTVLYLLAGGAGGVSTTNTGVPVAGGFNGGGYRYGFPGGGGASDVRINSNSYLARVIVAGGGGSCGAANKYGLYGGGTQGGAATESYGSYGYGGTQTGFTTTVTPLTSIPTTSSSSNYPGGFGFGGFGIYRSSGYAGAGGGGWYGGCGSYPNGSGDDDRGGGGGSGFILNASTIANVPAGYLLNSSYYLTNTSLLAGNTSFILPNGTTATGVSDNGYVRITIIDIKNLELYTKVNGTWKLMDDGYVKVNGVWRSFDSVYNKMNNAWKEL